MEGLTTSYFVETTRLNGREGNFAIQDDVGSYQWF